MSYLSALNQWLQQSPSPRSTTVCQLLGCGEGELTVCTRCEVTHLLRIPAVKGVCAIARRRSSCVSNHRSQFVGSSSGRDKPLPCGQNPSRPSRGTTLEPLHLSAQCAKSSQAGFLTSTKCSPWLASKTGGVVSDGQLSESVRQV